MLQWTYKGKPFDSDQIGDYIGFVYLITDLTNDKKYIGKKNFWSVRRLPPLKGKTRRRTVKKESDWKQYFGSSEYVKLLLEESGQKRFKREIIRLCNSKGAMSYYEAKEQFDREVLFSNEYYNEFIGCKIHAKHVK
jgi:hypothetical protein